MEYLKAISIPAHNVVLYGKAVGEMVERGMRVRQDGTVKGKFHYVTGYMGFSTENPELQEGYYFPFLLTETGEKMDFIKNGKPSKTGLDFEPYNVFRVTAQDTFEVKVDGKTVARFDFSQATFEEKKGERKMYSKLFDEGVCGVAQYVIIGVIDENTKDAANGVTFKNAIPDGFRLVHGYTLPSKDLEGSTKIDVGYPGNDTYYVNQLTLADYKEKGAGGEFAYNLRKVPSTDVTAKVDTAVTKGKIELAVEIVKLEV